MSVFFRAYALDLVPVEQGLAETGVSYLRLTDARNSVIRYTLDGSPVDLSSGVFLAPLSKGELLGCTLRARTYDLSGNPTGEEKTWSFKSKLVAYKQTVLPVTQNRDYKTYDWVKRHNTILELNKQRHPQVVLIGDSIVHFWGGVPKMGRANGLLSWEKYFAPREAANLGFGWDRTQNVLWRLRHGEIYGIKPKAWIVLIGTNNLELDSTVDILEGIEAVVKELRLHSPDAKVLLLALPRGKLNDTLRVRSLELATALTSAQLGDVSLNLSDKFIRSDGSIPRELMGDLLHPTEKGYEVIGQAVDTQLKDWGI